MSLEAPVKITPLPPPPLLSDTADAFDQKAFALTAALPKCIEETNALCKNVFGNAVIAEGAANAAAALVDAPRWSASANYEEGQATYSPINGRTYRRKAPGGITSIDPSLDPASWVDVLKTPPLVFELIGADTQLVSGHCYMLTAGGLTLTMPANPEPGDVVGIKCCGVGVNTLLLHNGGAIEGYADDVLIVDRYFAKALEWSGTTKGWVSTWL